MINYTQSQALMLSGKRIRVNLGKRDVQLARVVADEVAQQPEGRALRLVASPVRTHDHPIDR